MSHNFRKVTSKQVAKLAGVSQTTVSFVLNNVEGANISEETRQRVFEAARELNYVPDTAAQSLVRGRTNNIALVLMQPHQQVFIDEFIPSILTGINQVTREKGFRILVELVEDGTTSDVYINLLHSKEAAGIIVYVNVPTEADVMRIVHHTQTGLPIVSLSDIHSEIYSVNVDKLGGVRQVMKHLTRLGHRRIACISYAPENTNPHAQDRLYVYRRVLETASIPYDESLVRYGAYDPETGYEAMKSLLESSSPLPTAVYAMNDVMAFGALRAIQEHGLRVPDDIAIIGFDDIRLAQYANPPLTTVREPDVEHGRRAAEMLIALINGETPKEKHIKLATRLVVRDSCGTRRQS
jgi:LacI family transcriptional regulator